MASKLHKKRVAYSELKISQPLHDPTTPPKMTLSEGEKEYEVPKMAESGKLTGVKSTPAKRKLVCSACKTEFSRLCGLTRHFKVCKTLHDDRLEFERMSAEMKEREERIQKEKDQMEEALEKYQNFTEFLKDQLQTSRKGAKNKSVPQILAENYQSAPHMDFMNGKEIEKLREPKQKLVEEFISAYRHKTLDRMLGDFILSKFKKDDISQQPIHSTDVTRLSYVIKELMYDNTSEWIVDKKGVKATKYMITPLLQHVKVLCKEYQKKHTNIDPSDTSLSIPELEKISDNSREILNIYNFIDDGKLARKIHSYIAPKLIFDKDIFKEIEKRCMKALPSKRGRKKKI